MTLTRAQKLNNVGKSYNLYYRGNLIANVSLERGHEMTQEMAFEIINQFATEAGAKPRKYVEMATFEEAEVEV